VSTKLLTVRETAEVLNVERTTVYRLIARGQLSAIDLSVEGNRSGKGLTRIYESEVEDFIHRRTRNANDLRDKAITG
jgi:excisionase family DNA binding protein